MTHCRVLGLIVLLPLVLACGQSTTATSTPVVQTNVAASPAAIGASPAPSSPMQFVQVQVDAADAILQLQNTGGPNTTSTLDLDRWAIQVGATRVILPAGTRLAAGQNLIIHTGPAAGGAASAAASPGVAGGPSPIASPSPAAAGGTAVNIYLTQPDAGTLRQALQPGADVDLVDAQNTLRSRFTIPRS